MSNSDYIHFRVDKNYWGYWSSYTITNPYHDKYVKRYDRMLHRTLTKILCKSSLTSDQIKKLLRAPPDGPAQQDPVVKLILERKPALRVLFPESFNFPILWIAIMCCYLKSAELLVRCGANVSERCGLRLPPSYTERETTILQLLLQAYPSRRNQRLIRMVIEREVDLEARDIQGRTHLHIAVSRGRVQATKLLLKRGALVNVIAYNGSRPLIQAVRSSKAAKLLPLLLKYPETDVTVKDIQGRNALHQLALSSKEQVDLARVLIEKGVPLDDRTHWNLYQPIHEAALKGTNELIKLFLDHSADVNARARYDVFPLYLAAEYHNPPLVLETLLRRGANIDLKTVDGRTALHGACSRWPGNEKNIKLLLSVGADMLAEDQEGKTPFAIIDEQNVTRSVSRLMLKMLALRKSCMQSSVELKEERRIKGYPKLWAYYQKCTEKIREAKSAKIGKTGTFYELLTKCHCRIAMLMGNRAYEKKFKKWDINAFDMYAKDIRRAFCRAKRYHRATVKQERLINEAVYYALPYVIVIKVVRYILKCEKCELKQIVQESRSRSANSSSLRNIGDG